MEPYSPWRLNSELSHSLPSSSSSQRRRKRLLSCSLVQPLNRVNILGDDVGHYGHTGCVNALSWEQNGELLLTGSDDRTVRMWRMDTSDTEQEYPFVCTASLLTGHAGNIFNAQMLPYSTRIATVAWDSQVRVFDVGDGPLSGSERETPLGHARGACLSVLRCHSEGTKKVLTEESPDRFLTVSEDGTVRQHDLRTPHQCGIGGSEACPLPLVMVPFELTALSSSPLAPYQFVVGGRSPYGYLFDRRQIGRIIQAEWGRPLDEGDLTTCVRRFGRTSRGPRERRRSTYITGARMAKSNGHEVLLSYSGDAAYLYSTRDSPADPAEHPHLGILPGNSRTKLARRPLTGDEPMEHVHTALLDISQYEESDDFGDDLEDDENDNDDDEEDEDEDDEDAGHADDDVYDRVPVVLPCRRFEGAANIETVKDVNFLGPSDEFVTSGSDDGNFFMWKKATGKSHAIYEGDSSIVNVIESHPTLPLIAVSGIDNTVKLFAPARGVSAFSRLHSADDIMSKNARASENSPSLRVVDLAELLLLSGRSTDVGEEGTSTRVPECTQQ